MCDLYCLLCHGWKYSFDEYCDGSYCKKYKKYFKNGTGGEEEEKGVANGDIDSIKEG